MALGLAAKHVDPLVLSHALDLVVARGPRNANHDGLFVLFGNQGTSPLTRFMCSAYSGRRSQLRRSIHGIDIPRNIPVITIGPMMVQR